MLKINYTCCVLSRQKTNKKYKQSLKVRERQTKELRKISFVRARPHPRLPASTPAISLLDADDKRADGTPAIPEQRGTIQIIIIMYFILKMMHYGKE